MLQEERPMSEKVAFHGRVTSVQPRIRLLRSFGERTHGYLGYVLRLDGSVGGEAREFTVGVGKGRHAKLEFQVGDVVQGECESAGGHPMEPAEFYKATKLKVLQHSPVFGGPPPWCGVAPPLEEYRARGHRRLDARTYGSKCLPCLWGCRMPVEITPDQWNPGVKKYRTEPFCYGPKSCRLYKAGPTRKVQGRKAGMVWEEEDWVDEEATGHRED